MNALNRMNLVRLISGLRCRCAGLALVLGFAAFAAEPPSNWRYAQELVVPQPGLVKVSLPPATLGLARPNQADLRLLDPQGREVPYLLEPSLPAPAVVRPVKAFQVTLNPTTTVLILETGLDQALESVTLETPAAAFIKAVKVEGSTDGAAWRQLARGLPIFRQRNGPSHLRLALSPGVWAYLRLTVDDARSEAVPFARAWVQTAATPTASESMGLPILERVEEPGQSRLLLGLPAANLRLASLELEVDAPVFTREVTVAVKEVTENTVQERVLARGTIHRLAVEGQPASSNLTVNVEASVPARELLVFVLNQDSPPLPIRSVRGTRRPLYLVFHAQLGGTYEVLTGNPQCPSPRYDLGAFGPSLKSAPVSSLTFSLPTNHAAFRAPETLPTVQETGAPLEVSAWKYRKTVRLARVGAQQLELDLEVLARAQPGLQDLRLLRGENQAPFILERTSIARTVSPAVSVAADPKRPKVSRWRLGLPHPRLPLTRLTCVSPTTLFQRDLQLYEEVADERGTKHQHLLGTATWTRTPTAERQPFILDLSSRPETEALFLETDNGDNPPVALESLQCFYPVSRILFKSTTTTSLDLYYGNPQAGAPQYDLSLVAGQLLGAEKTAATLGPEEPLRTSSWREQLASSGGGGVLFWCVLGLVVAGLVVVIARLLPKPPEAAN